MRTKIPNKYRGGDIALRINGNTSVLFDGTHLFTVYIYPDGTDIASAAGQLKVRKIYSTDRRTQRDGDGYVNFVDGENAAVCTLPASVTMDMVEGQYTVEIRHNTNSNTGAILVVKKNTAFNLIAAVSQLGNY